jgi:hypothetical protein
MIGKLPSKNGHPELVSRLFTYLKSQNIQHFSFFSEVETMLAEGVPQQYKFRHWVVSYPQFRTY